MKSSSLQEPPQLTISSSDWSGQLVTASHREQDRTGDHRGVVVCTLYSLLRPRLPNSWELCHKGIVCPDTRIYPRIGTVPLPCTLYKDRDLNAKFDKLSLTEL